MLNYINYNILSFKSIFSFTVGGMKRGHCYIWDLLKHYTKTNDVVVQYGGDTGIFSLVGSNMGRYMMILEGSEEYTRELPNVLKQQEDHLNARQKRAQEIAFVTENIAEDNISI